MSCRKGHGWAGLSDCPFCKNDSLRAQLAAETARRVEAEKENEILCKQVGRIPVTWPKDEPQERYLIHLCRNHYLAELNTMACPYCRAEQAEARVKQLEACGIGADK